MHRSKNSRAVPGGSTFCSAKRSARWSIAMFGVVGAGIGRPRSLPPKTERCQAPVGIAARFGYFLTLSPLK